jgi:virulence factor Mce-like protein
MLRGKALLAGLVFPLMLLAVVYALFLHDPAPSGVVVRAEFQDVDQLVKGHDVRIHGTKVGSVAKTALTDHGTVLVTMALYDGAPQVRSDATASIRVADLLGDVSLVLEPGHATSPLRGPIPTRHTFVTTHVQDVLNVFDRPTRTALQSLLVELGRALEARGADVNRAVLGLSPLLREVTRISSQLGDQRAELDRLLVSARALTHQLAPQSADIERLIDGLDRTLAVTAGHSRDLDSGLRGLPATLRQTRTTMAALGRTARAATPLAGDLNAAAPQLTASATGLAPFARRVRPALGQLDPVLVQARKTLTAGRRSLPRLTAALRTSREAAPSLRDLSNLMTPLTEYLVKGVMGGLGALAAEPGEQAVDKSGTRNWYRAELVLGCEMFGVKTRPGCLADVVQGLAGSGARTSRPEPKRQSAHVGPVRRPDLPRPKLPDLPSTPKLPKVPKLPDVKLPDVKVPPLPPPVKHAVDGATGAAGNTAPHTSGSTDDLLDYLLGS